MMLRGGKKKVSRKRKWVRRGLWSAAVLAAVGLASPFVFTAPLLRFFLSHSDYRDLPLQFGRARLSPLGGLTLYDVRLKDAEAAGQPDLASADRVEVAFRWGDLRVHRLEQVSIENLDLTLRPGRNGPSILRLIDPAPAATPPGAAAGTSSELPWWVEQVLVTGNLRVQGAPYTQWLLLAGAAPDKPIPLQMILDSRGTPAGWTHELSLVAGDAGGMGRIVGKGSLAGVGRDLSLKLESLSGERLSGTLTAAMAAGLSFLPDGAQRPAQWTLDSLKLAGSAELKAGTILSANVEVRDLTGRATVDGVPVKLDHLASAARIEGKFGARRDIALTALRCKWDLAQLQDWRFGQCDADVSLEGTDLVLTDCRGTLNDAELIATGAFDTNTHTISRGRVWLNNFPAQQLLAELPDTLRARLPWNLSGMLSARVFLTENDPDLIAAHVELVCPERLAAHVPPRAPALPAPPAATGAAPGFLVHHAPGQTVLAMENTYLSADLSWDKQPGSRVELSHGRLTADSTLLASPQGKGDQDLGLTMSKIKSDFTFSGDRAVLNDLYADLPGNGRITAEADYALASGTLRKGLLSLSGMDASLLDPWLPAGWALSGQIDADLQASATPDTASASLSLGFASQTELKSADASVVLTGTPAPALGFRGTFNRTTGAWQIEKAELSNISKLQVDVGMLDTLQAIAGPPRTSALAGAVAQMKSAAAEDGAVFASLDLLGITGSFTNRIASGSVLLNGLDLGTAGEQDHTLLQNLTFKGDVDLPLDPAPTLGELHVTAGQALAEKCTIGENVFSAISAQISAASGKVEIGKLAFSFAEGAFEGDAAVGLPGQVESLNLTFTDINQQVVTRGLYPDVFTAEGPVSGKVSLARTPAGGLAGTMELSAEKQGRLKISRETTKQYLLPIAQGAVKAQGSLFPPNFDEIFMAQLADYPYTTGHAVLRDNAPSAGRPDGTLFIKLDYDRPPIHAGEPGFMVPMTLEGVQVKANYEFEIRGFSLSVNNSIARILQTMTGLQESLVKPRE